MTDANLPAPEGTVRNPQLVPGVNTYLVRATLPCWDRPLEVELIATSGEKAISRARGAMFHYYRSEVVYRAAWTVVWSRPGVAFSEAV